ncbi:hypothetical protein GCM10009544_51130 [Streptomyces stramineus]|uniref:Uncharacterized protein n=1 Tax=Streptomyces stramineus TaxID=173861 RepID=A0ABP3KMT3_9ACTN
MAEGRSQPLAFARRDGELLAVLHDHSHDVPSEDPGGFLALLPVLIGVGAGDAGEIDDAPEAFDLRREACSVCEGAPSLAIGFRPTCGRRMLLRFGPLVADHVEIVLASEANLK